MITVSMGHPAIGEIFTTKNYKTHIEKDRLFYTRWERRGGGWFCAKYLSPKDFGNGEGPIPLVEFFGALREIDPNAAKENI